MDSGKGSKGMGMGGPAPGMGAAPDQMAPDGGKGKPTGPPQGAFPSARSASSSGEDEFFGGHWRAGCSHLEHVELFCVLPCDDNHLWEVRRRASKKARVLGFALVRHCREETERARFNRRLFALESSSE